MKKHSFLKSFGYAFKGLGFAWRERNFRLHILSASIVIILGFFFNITVSEWLILLICIGLVVAFEIINTAVEELVNFVTPEYNEKAGRIKDLAAAAVLFASIIALITGLIIFLPHLY